MLKILSDLGPLFVESLKKLPAHQIVSYTLIAAALALIAFIVIGCGTLSYEPHERSTITIENTAPTKGTDNGKTQ